MIWQHWRHSCWVAKMWHNSTEEDPYNDLPPPEQCGWCKDEEGDYTCDWECPEVIQRVTDTIDFLTKTCSCKKGCQTNVGVGKRTIRVGQDACVKAAKMWQQ